VVKLVEVLLVLIAIFSFGVVGANKESKPSEPMLQFNEVTAMFGRNLEPEPGLLQDLLLAVAVDHTASNVPDATKEIGIPYILSRGIAHWASRLKKGAPLDVIVNNALYLLYSKDRSEESDKTALNLMKLAANKNYWPAKYYIAETNLKNYLAADYELNSKVKMLINDKSVQKIADVTMDYFVDCAKRGFAPCQYRVGTWLLTSEMHVAEALKALESTINTSMNDSRYKRIFDQRLGHAALILSSIGPEFGYSEEKINTYKSIIAMTTQTKPSVEKKISRTEDQK
jgi:hypothetical protein